VILDAGRVDFICPVLIKHHLTSDFASLRAQIIKHHLTSDFASLRAQTPLFITWPSTPGPRVFDERSILFHNDSSSLKKTDKIHSKGMRYTH